MTDSAPGYNDLIPINLASDTLGTSAPAGTDPLGVAITPDGNVAFVVDRGSNIVPGAVTPITISGATPVVGTAVTVGSDPDAVAINPDGDDVYVANYGDGTISQIALSDDVAGTVTASTAGSDPTGLAVTPDGSATYVADDVPGLSTSTGTLSMLTLPTAGGVPAAIGVPAGPSAVAITPDQAPVAVLHVTAAPSSEPSYFDASQSTFPTAGPASYTWNFGDGTSAETTTQDHTTHTYAEGGDFTASVTITDVDGTSTTQSFTGQTVGLNGGPSARATAAVNVPYVAPSVTGVSPNSGDAGEVTSLIVSGENLFGVTAVDVGGVPVTGWSVNDAGTEISNVLAPSSLPAGSVDVTVTNPGGTSPITPADVFTYLPTSTPITGAPTVTALSASAGPLSGGTGVTITGTNFTGTTAVDFGTTAATSFTVNSAGTQITAVSPATGTAGTVDVTVTTTVATSADTPADAFTYLAPAAPSTTPTVTGISPSSGPDAGLTTVTVTGTNLTDVTGVSFGAVAAESFVSISGTSLTAVSPAVAAAGTVDLTVSTLAGTSAPTPADAFTYESGVASAGPVVSGVTPSSGPLAGGNTVVITGSNFVDLSPGAVLFGSNSATYSVNSAGTIITASAPSATGVGTVDVTVTNPLGASVITPADAYTYLANATFAPVVTSITPSSGPVAGDTAVTLTGSDLSAVTTVEFGTTGVTSFTTAGDGDSITVNSPTATVAGTVSVTATSAYGTSAATSADAFTYLALSPPSTDVTITSVAPAEGPETGGTGVVITGTGFTDASAVDFGATAAASYSVSADGTQITAVSPDSGSADSVDVSVTADAQTSDISTADVFTYLDMPTPPGPQITSISPSGGPISGGTVVTITGTNLSDPLLVDFGTTPGTNVSVNAAGTVLTVTAPDSDLAGPVSIVVVTAANASTPSADTTYTYAQPTSTYNAVVPHRLLDTRRTGEGGPFGAHTTRTLTIAGTDGVPLDATGVLVNLTVTDTTAATQVSIYPTGGSVPTAPSDVVGKGQTIAHLEEVQLGTNGAVSIGNSAGSAQIVVDLEGYYTPGTGASGGFVGLTPSLVLNTAAKSGGGAIVSGKPRRLVVTGVGGVPKTHVAAVLFYLTSTGGTKASYATVWPAGTAEPNASVLNWLPKEGVTNLVQMDVGSGGAIDIANEYGSAQFTVVVVGYITGAGSATPGAFNMPLPATELNIFTLSAQGPLVWLQVAGRGSVPSNATFAVLNVTFTGSSAATQIRIYAYGGAKPATADFSIPKGGDVSMLVVAPIGADGKISLATSAGHLGVTVSIQGYAQ